MNTASGKSYDEGFKICTCSEQAPKFEVPLKFRLVGQFPRPNCDRVAAKFRFVRVPLSANH